LRRAGQSIRWFSAKAGDLKPDTSVSNICAFAEAVFGVLSALPPSAFPQITHSLIHSLPSNPEVLFRYVSFLTAQGKFDDAILLANTTRKLVPDNQQYENLVSQLRNVRRQSKATER
jgi:hypothetical protein